MHEDEGPIDRAVRRQSGIDFALSLGLSRVDFFRMVGEVAPALVVSLLDESIGMIVEATAFAERMLGFNRNELRGMSVDELIPPERRGAHRKRMEEFRERPSARPMASGPALEALRKDGQRISVVIGLHPIPNYDCVIVFMLQLP